MKKPIFHVLLGTEKLPNKNKCPMTKQVSRGKVRLKVREGHKARQEDSGLREDKFKRRVAGAE